MVRRAAPMVLDLGCDDATLLRSRYPTDTKLGIDPSDTVAAGFFLAASSEILDADHSGPAARRPGAGSAAPTPSPRCPECGWCATAA